ncbi:MAG: 3-phosphoshikimate 1-carboxyvinyltransferase, partial [Acidimicrobiia bacterium]|nr:3-phosphoshikimate 1-carboxyvinyltransferase [Acidimicrobiia bacterium]
DLEVSAQESSQMVSAVLLTAPLAQSETRLHRRGGDGSLGYLDISLDVMRHFGAPVEVAEFGFVVAPGGYESSAYEIPPDASTAVYPLVAAAVTGEQVTVPGRFGDQPDLRILAALEQMGCEVGLTDTAITLRGPEKLAGISTDMADAPDASIALAVACALADGPSRIEGLGSLRLKESDRLAALASELTRFGSRVDEGPTWLTINPARPRPATFSSHNDHRIAMSLALLGLVEEGIGIEHPDAVNKTWPGFWNWLQSTGASVAG